MNLKLVILIFLLTISVIAECQTVSEINKTDKDGKKQGQWIKKYPNETIMYDGYFKDNHPVGEFRRYNEDKTLKSLLIYSDNGHEAVAIIYHPNGNIASTGKYINQLKEGKWQFFSAYVSDYLILEENYTNNIRNGTSVKFYPDSTVAEKMNYVNDIKQGEWIQYYDDGSICLKSYFLDGKVNDKFEVWFKNGHIELSGQYKNDKRDGLFYIYNEDGSLRYKIEYRDGVALDRQKELDESDFLDSLEKNKGKISDPEITGIIR